VIFFRSIQATIFNEILKYFQKRNMKHHTLLKIFIDKSELFW